MKGRKTLVENAKIADQQLKEFILEVVNAPERQVDGSDDYLARKYRQFFPTRHRDIQLMAQLFWRVKDPNDPFLRKEIGEILCRAVIGELRDRLRAVWLAEYDNVAEWRLFMLQLQVHQVTNVEDQRSRHLYPPSPDTPIELAIDWLRRNLLMLRVCRNPDCASPFFVASSAQKGLCSAACIAVAQKVHKRRWWTKERASPTHKRESDQSPVEQEIEDPSMVSGSGTGVAEGGQVAGHSLKARPGTKILRRETARVSGGESERTLKRFLHNVVNAPENRVDHLVSTYAKFFPSQTRTERLLTHQMNQDLVTSETLGTIKEREKRQALEQLRESLQSIWNADDTHTARWRLFTLQAELHRSTDPEVYGSDEELFPPPADRPVHQALELLRRNLHMLKECGNAACQTFRLFIASKGGQKYCSTSCTTAAQQLEDEPFSLEESACAFRLPIVGSQHDLGLSVRRCRTVELQSPPATKASSYISLGLNVHRGVARTIRVTTEDQLHHALYIGATGTGKSTLITNNLIEQARMGRADLALIDPSGATADDFLEHFPRERVDDLIIVDLEDREFPVPLNLLLWKSVEERDLLIDTLYSTLLSTYKSPDYFGPVFETYFRSGLRLLLGDQPRTDFTPTLLELPQVFRSPNFRKYLVAGSQDDDVKDAIEEANRVSGGDLRLENVAPYVTSKLNRFLQDTQLRRIVGHGGMALDFRDIMDSGKIVVFKLAQGRLGAHTAGILTAQIVARFRLAAMSRANVPCTERRPFLLYCDEAHAVCDDNVADMLSQCRKYSLGLVLATQYARQLHDKGVLQAVLGNVGTLAVFRVSAEDASLLEPVFSPVIGAQDLVECPNWNGYMRICSGQTPSRPFSFWTVRPSASRDPELARELRERNRRKWGVSAKNIDAEIRTRRKVIKDLPLKPLLKVAMSLEESMPDERGPGGTDGFAKPQE